jgi:hypothetical protein
MISHAKGEALATGSLQKSPQKHPTFINQFFFKIESNSAVSSSSIFFMETENNWRKDPFSYSFMCRSLLCRKQGHIILFPSPGLFFCV